MAHSLTIHGAPVPVTFEPGVTADPALVLSAPILLDWAARLDPEISVKSIEIQSVDLFGPRVGFIKMKTLPICRGVAVPGIVFLRGGAVSILVELRCGDARWALCCRQARVPAGSAGFLEIPAGMLDGSGKFAGVAAKELEEEAGLEVREEELIDLTELAYGSEPRLLGMYPSVGACDEFLRLYYMVKEVSEEELATLHGRVGGCIEEGESIVLELVPLDQLWCRAPDAKTLASLLLVDKLRAAGKLPL